MRPQTQRAETDLSEWQLPRALSKLRSNCLNLAVLITHEARICHYTDYSSPNMLWGTFFVYHLAEREKTSELGVSDTLFMHYENEGWDTLMKTEQKQRVEKCFRSEQLGRWRKAGWRHAARGHRSGSNPLQGVCVCAGHTLQLRCVRSIVRERQLNQNTKILIVGLIVDLQQLNHEKYFPPLFTAT